MSRKLDIKKTQIYHDYYTRLKNICLALFKWNNLPKSCDARFLEKTLFNYGIAMFVDDENLKHIFLKCTPSNELNHYEIPISYTGYSINYNMEFNLDECVIIRNNYLEKSTDSTVMLFAERLAKIELTSIVNINAQKTPILIRCDEKEKNSFIALYNQYEEDRPVIFGSKALLEKPFEVIKTEAPFIADKLREEKRAVWNEFLEFIGINTNPSESKRERLITNEVDANNEQVEIQGCVMLLTRQEACEEINEKFGLDISVEMRLDVVKSLINNYRKEFTDNGEVYN